jgi:transcriptional regulator with XRE-family HTH domain
MFHDMMNIGKKLKTLRTSQKLSQRALSKLAGLNPTHVQLLESGRYPNPRIETLLKLSVALNVPAEKLYE